MQPVLSVKNVIKKYKENILEYTALYNVSFDIYKGEFIGIMGPSGAGKTTLLNVVSTIDEPTSGEVLLNSINMTKLKDNQKSDFRGKELGFIFQEYNLLDTLTIKENITLPLSISKITSEEIDKRLNEISSKLGIEDIIYKYPYEVSGGQRQRTSAARAFITNPSLILADEPTGALDSKASANLLQIMNDVNNKNKATIMMVTHDAFAASYCKRIIFLKDGQVVDEIYKNSTRKVFFDKILDVMYNITNN